MTTQYIILHEDGTAALADTMSDAREMLEIESQNWEGRVVGEATERGEERTVVDQERVRGRLYKVDDELTYHFEGGHVIVDKG
jgi:hypothetical protein